MELGSEILDLEKTHSGSRIPDPGVKKARDPESGAETQVTSVLMSPLVKFKFCLPSCKLFLGLLLPATVVAICPCREA